MSPPAAAKKSRRSLCHHCCNCCCWVLCAGRQGASPIPLSNSSSGSSSMSRKALCLLFFFHVVLDLLVFRTHVGSGNLWVGHVLRWEEAKRGDRRQAEVQQLRKAAADLAGRERGGEQEATKEGGAGTGKGEEDTGEEGMRQNNEDGGGREGERLTWEAGARFWEAPP